MLLQSDAARAEALLAEAKQGVKARWEQYQELAAEPPHDGNGKG
jgi:hypothetical protein